MLSVRPPCWRTTAGEGMGKVLLVPKTTNRLAWATMRRSICGGSIAAGSSGSSEQAANLKRTGYSLSRFLDANASQQSGGLLDHYRDALTRRARLASSLDC